MINLKSKVTSGVLNYFFLNPESSQYVNKLAKILELDPKNLYRKLIELEEEGILISEFQGQERYFKLNNKYPLIESYRQIIFKTVGIENQLKELFKDDKNIKESYIFGSYAKDKMDANSDIDLLVVVEQGSDQVYEKLAGIEKRIQREINPVITNKDEYERKLNEKNEFLENIFSNKNIKVK
jgi:predicted nucleotidyltransferase